MPLSVILPAIEHKQTQSEDAREERERVRKQARLTIQHKLHGNTTGNTHSLGHGGHSIGDTILNQGGGDVLLDKQRKKSEKDGQLVFRFLWLQGVPCCRS